LGGGKGINEDWGEIRLSLKGSVEEKEENLNGRIEVHTLSPKT